MLRAPAVHTRWRPGEPTPLPHPEARMFHPTAFTRALLNSWLCEPDSSKLVLFNSGFESLGKFVFLHPPLNKLLVDHLKTGLLGNHILLGVWIVHTEPRRRSHQ